MNKTDHLLTILAEECAEVQKICCKALRFGLDDTNPATKQRNKDELIHEVNDLLAVVKMLAIPEEDLKQQQKMSKVEYWLHYSSDRGRLEEEDTNEYRHWKKQEDPFAEANALLKESIYKYFAAPLFDQGAMRGVSPVATAYTHLNCVSNQSLDQGQLNFEEKR